MIISASRRTDIPCYFSGWLLHRVRAGEVRVRNPFNAAQVRTVSLRRADVDAFVFWTKDPAPMTDVLAQLDAMGYPSYFQYTMTPYGPDIEPGLRPKPEIERTLVQLSRAIGKERVLWRYDPILLTGAWTPDRHESAFARLCDAFAGYTPSVTISFVDAYKKLKTPLVHPLSEGEMLDLARRLSAIASAHGLRINACCEPLDLTPFGIGRAACIDALRVSSLCGYNVAAKPDTGQRPGCNCARSVDIGVYNTCRNGCTYCYANHSPASITRNLARHDPAGASLIE